MSSTSRAATSMMIYGVSLLVTKGFALISLPIMTYFLAVEEIGRLDLIATSSVLLCIAAGVCLHESLYRFIANYDALESQKQFVNKVFSLSLIISTVSSVFWLSLVFSGYLANPWMNDYQLLLIGIIVSFEGPLSICTAWVRIQNRAMLFLKVSIGMLTAQFSLLLVALVTLPTPTSVLLVSVVCTLGQFLFLTYHLDIKFELPEFALSKSIITYSAPLMFSALVLFGLSGGERWIIGINADLTELGQYAIAIKFAIATGVLMQPFGMWWMPKRFQTFRQFGAQKVVTYSQYGLVYLCVLCVAVAWMAKIIISLVLNDDYPSSILYSSGLIAVVLLKECTELANFGILKAKQNQWIFINNTIWTALGLALCWWFSSYGVVAIIASIWLAQLGRLVCIFSKSQSLTPLPYKNASCALLILVCLSLVLTSALPFTLLQALCLLILQCVVVALVAYKIGLIPKWQNVSVFGLTLGRRV